MSAREGQCVMRTTPDGLVIDRADRHINVSDDLLQFIRSGQCTDGVRIEGDILTLGAVNRTVAYRVTEREHGVWDADLLP